MLFDALYYDQAEKTFSAHLITHKLLG